MCALLIYCLLDLWLLGESLYSNSVGGTFVNILLVV